MASCVVGLPLDDDGRSRFSDAGLAAEGVMLILGASPLVCLIPSCAKGFCGVLVAGGELDALSVGISLSLPAGPEFARAPDAVSGLGAGAPSLLPSAGEFDCAGVAADPPSFARRLLRI